MRLVADELNKKWAASTAVLAQNDGKSILCEMADRAELRRVQGLTERGLHTLETAAELANRLLGEGKIDVFRLTTLA